MHRYEFVHIFVYIYINGQTLGHLQKPIPLTPKLSAFSAARFRDPTEDRMHLPPDWVEVVPPGWGTRGKSYYKNSFLVGDWYGYSVIFCLVMV